MAKVRGKSTPEFKRQALTMRTDQRLRVAEVARRLGVSESRRHEWKKAVRVQGADAVPGSGHQTPIEAENRRLRAEGKRLERERDIRKQATAFFARLGKESSPGSRNAASNTRSPSGAAFSAGRGPATPPGRSDRPATRPNTGRRGQPRSARSTPRGRDGTAAPA